MKIGEAGEAFFVFETDEEDVPEDLLTSPLLEATKVRKMCAETIVRPLTSLGEILCI
jgi:phosphatidate phosphatase PAH1